MSDPIRDPFTAHRADYLGFLSTPAPMPGAGAPVIRGAGRVFDPLQTAVANESAAAAAVADGAAVATAVEPMVAAAQMVHNTVHGDDGFDIDLSTLSLEQLGRLMTSCASHMMHSLTHAAEALGR